MHADCLWYDAWCACMQDLEDDGLSSEASGLSNDAEPGSGEGSLSEQPHREHSSDQENNPDKQQAQSAVSTGAHLTPSSHYCSPW